MRHAAPIFRKQNSGIIINTSSQAGLGEPGTGHYAAAKEGIVGFTRSIARDLGPFGVRCNTLRPLGLSRMCNPPLDSTIEWISELQDKYGIPGTGNLWCDFHSPRKLDAAEVAAFVVWLCTDAAANITGRTFQIGDGQVALYSEPDLERSAFRKGGWNLEELDALGASRYLTGGLRNPYKPGK